MPAIIGSQAGTTNALGGLQNLKGGLGTSFKTLFSGAPNAPIKPAHVDLPTRGDYGAPVTNPTINDPTRGSYGTPDATGIAETRANAIKANYYFNNPRQSSAFKEVMGLAQEQTGQQAAERSRQARDASQRRGYSGGFEDSAREAQQDRMNALASAGFAGAQSIREQEGQHYGQAVSAFANLMGSYQQAKSAGDIAYAQDLTRVHMQNAENTLKTAGLNMNQQIAFAQGLNDAKQLQAKLDQDYNNSLIDNNRYIQAQQQIAAQLLAQQMALQEKAREYDADAAFREKQFGEQQRQFDLNLKANPATATRTFSDERYGAGPSYQKPKGGSFFSELI